MTELDLEAIKTRCEAATPGPWHTFLNMDGCPSVGTLADLPTGYADLPMLGYKILAHGMSDSDQEFIAHARENVPMLVAEVERLRVALAKESDRVLGLLRKIDDYRNLYPELDDE